ncbi:hypothetical protein [Flavitalea sp.]|nr:hypothetical protein [Flavitalea sp.]
MLNLYINPILLQLHGRQIDATTLAITAIATVITSLLTAYFTTLKTIRTERDKIRSNVHLAYSNKILEKRLEIYPLFYALMSDLAKDIFYNTCTLDKIQKFQKHLDMLDSEHVIFFSGVSTVELGKLRRFLKNILFHKTALTIDQLSELKGLLGDVENSLKRDIGIYIVEFNDPEGKLETKTYKDVNNQAVSQSCNRNNNTQLSKINDIQFWSCF